MTASTCTSLRSTRTRTYSPAPTYVDTRGIRHNSKGFRRSRKSALRKPSGTYRIFLMGGSTAYGMGGLWPHIDDRYPVLKNTETN